MSEDELFKIFAWIIYVSVPILLLLGVVLIFQGSQVDGGVAMVVVGLASGIVFMLSRFSRERRLKKDQIR